MSDYAKATLSATFSEKSDYTDPEWVTNWADYEVTPDEAETYKVICDTSSGTTVATSKFANATLLAVKNTDATNYVTATFRSAGNSAVDNIIQIAAKGLLVVTDFTVASDLLLVANGSAVDCKILIVGS